MRDRERERERFGRFYWVIQFELSSSVHKKHDVRTLPHCCCIVGSSCVSELYVLRFLPQAYSEPSKMEIDGVSLPWVAFLMAKTFNLRFSSSRNYSTALGMHWDQEEIRKRPRVPRRQCWVPVRRTQLHILDLSRWIDLWWFVNDYIRLLK